MEASFRYKRSGSSIREAVKRMKAHNIKGHIINVNAVLGHTVIDFPSFSVYPASKFALTALTETDSIGN